MGSRSQRRAELFVVMQLRRLGFGRNPLRRRVDRIEAALLLTALTVALLVIPAAAAIGTTIRDRSEQSAAAARAAAHPVHARTLESAADAVPSTLGLSTTLVPVRWYDASGSAHEGQADVLIGTAAGADLTIWLDETGAMTRAPHSPGDSATLGTAVALTLPMLAWPTIFALFCLARRPLDRRRADAWARDWKQTSPRWTGRS
ncbi:hypothetical protein ACIA58_22440 [Kribbella sp. NPDC051586]|uniref:Rv1733c family protein n=1 Tax=Kribbella sp. NPDC051586 TaxID=3364118 RepID=UPI003792FDBE